MLIVILSPPGADEESGSGAGSATSPDPSPSAQGDRKVTFASGLSTTPRRENLLHQLHYGHSVCPGVLVTPDGLHQRMVVQVLPNSVPQCPGSHAMRYTRR